MGLAGLGFRLVWGCQIVCFSSRVYGCVGLVSRWLKCGSWNGVLFTNWGFGSIICLGRWRLVFVSDLGFRSLGFLFGFRARFSEGLRFVGFGIFLSLDLGFWFWGGAIRGSPELGV